MADKHKSVTSSTYSGNTTSAATATEQKVSKVNTNIDQYNMKTSSDSYKAKRRQNQAEAKARREEEGKPTRT